MALLHGGAWRCDRQRGGRRPAAFSKSHDGTMGHARRRAPWRRRGRFAQSRSDRVSPGRRSSRAKSARDLLAWPPIAPIPTSSSAYESLMRRCRNLVVAATLPLGLLGQTIAGRSADRRRLCSRLRQSASAPSGIVMRLPPDVLAGAGVSTSRRRARNGASWRGRRRQRNGAGQPMHLPVSRRLSGAECLPPAVAPPRREHALCGAGDLLFLFAIAGVVQW